MTQACEAKVRAAEGRMDMQEWFTRVRRLGAGVRSAWGTLPKWQREDFSDLGLESRSGRADRQHLPTLRGLSDKKRIK
jgi:hypothetical protein